MVAVLQNGLSAASQGGARPVDEHAVRAGVRDREAGPRRRDDAVVLRKMPVGIGQDPVVVGAAPQRDLPGLAAPASRRLRWQVAVIVDGQYELHGSGALSLTWSGPEASSEEHTSGLQSQIRSPY